MPILPLSIGNIAIAIVEALLVWVVFRRGLFRCFWVMLAANYASAAAGLLLRSRFNGLVVPWLREPGIFNANSRLFVFAVIAFLMALLIEAPFVLWLAKRSECKASRGLVALLLANVVSYAGLATAYWRISAQSLLTALTPVHVPAPRPGDEAFDLWFIDAQTHSLRVVGIDGRPREEVLAGAFPNADYLAVIIDPQKSAASVIASSLEANTMPTVAVLPYGTVAVDDTGRELGWHGDLSARRFPGLAESVRIWVGEWAGRDTVLWDESTPKRALLRIAHENALDQWRIQYVTVLPDRRLVFQLGPNQICIADSEARTLALIACGRGPIVVRRPARE